MIIYMKFDERNKKNIKIPLFISMATVANVVLLIPIFLAYLVPLDVVVTGNITAKFVKFGVNLTFFAPWLAMAAILNLFTSPLSKKKLRWIFLQSFMKFDEWNPKGFQIPLFCFHGNCGKVSPTDSDFVGLSRSTRCGSCSYQVSSISVRRVTRYDHLYEV